MGWLAGNNWLWLLLAAVLGGLVTAFLTLRKATQVSETVETVSRPDRSADVGSGASAGLGTAGAVGVGAAGVGAGAVGAGALAADTPDAPATLTPEEAGWAPEADIEPDPALEEPAAEEPAVEEPALEEPVLPTEAEAVPTDEGAGLGAAVEPDAAALSADEAGWAPVSEPEAAGWAPAEDEPVAAEEPAVIEEPAVVEPEAEVAPAVEVPEAADPSYHGSHAAPAGDPLSDPLTAPIEQSAAPEVDGEPVLFAAGGAAAAGGAVAAGAYGAGSADPLADGAAPGAAYTVKGNADSMKFHTSESPYFGRTRAEVWFDSEESARGAGFHRWDEKAEPAAVASIPDGAYGPGSADPGENGDAPSAAYFVKGNADSMLFHDTDSPYYSRTKAEVWFDSVETARKAGFAAWNDK